MFKPFPDQGQKGYFLADVLAAFTVCSLLAAITISIFMPISGWIAESKRRTEATWYAASILAGLNSESDMIITENVGKTAQDLDLPGVVTVVGMNNVISRMQARDDPRLYDVTVTVNWGVGAKAGSLQLSTIIRKDERP